MVILTLRLTLVMRPEILTVLNNVHYGTFEELTVGN